MKFSKTVAAIAILSSGLALGTAGASGLVTHLFPHRDGEVDPNSGTNAGAVLRVGEGGRIAWITYQTGGADLAMTRGSALTLYLDTLIASGTLSVFALEQALAVPELDVELADLDFDDLDPVATIALTGSDQEKIIRLGLDTLLSSGTFHGLVLAASSGLEAEFGSKDSDLQPLIELQYAFADSAEISQALAAVADAGIAADAAEAAAAAASASAAAADASATAASGSASAAAVSATASAASASTAGGSAAASAASATAASTSAYVASSAASSASGSASSASASASAASASASAAAASAEQAAFAGQIVLSATQTAPSGYSHTGIRTLYETPWYSRASAGGRYAVASVAYNGKLYVGGGFNGSHLSTFEAYAPSTNSWASLAGLPAVTWDHSMAEVGGKLYSIGGIVSPGSTTNAVYEYDVSTNAWTAKANMPASVCDPAAVGYNGKIYVFGGSANISSTSNVSTTYEYDPSTNSWSTKASMGASKSQAHAVVVGNKIHVIGGLDNSMAALNHHEVYDPSANTWTTAAALPSAMRLGVAAAKDGRVYIHSYFGGPNYQYDAALDAWIKLANNVTPRYACAGGIIGNTFYIALGYGGGTLGSTEAYDLPKSVYYLQRD